MAYDIYSAFGNRIRIKLIECLAGEPKNVTQLIRTCGLAQSAVSQHLIKLKRAGVVVTSKKGREITYFLKFRQAAEISRLIQDLEKETIKL